MDLLSNVIMVREIALAAADARGIEFEEGELRAIDWLIQILEEAHLGRSDA